MQTDTESAPAGDADATNTPDPDESTLGTKAELEVLEGCKRRIKASVAVEKVREELEKNYRDLAKTIQLPGFRKGRVPRQLLESRYGEEVEKEVKESMLQQSFGEVTEEQELDVFTSPKFDDVEFGVEAGLSFTVDFEIRPVFDLPEYKGVSVALEAAEEQDDDKHIDEEIEQLRKRLGSFEEGEMTSPGVEDFLTGSYRLLVEGEEVKEVEKAFFKPSTETVDEFFVEGLSDKVTEWAGGFDAEAIGRGDAKPPVLGLEIKIPAQYADEVLRGKDARLEFSLAEVHRQKLPELDDEFAKLTGSESLDDLKSKIREQLNDRRSNERNRLAEEKILDVLAEATEIEVPEGLVEVQLRQRRSQREQELIEKGVSSEDIKATLAKEGATEDSKSDGDGDAKDEAEIRSAAKKWFILEGVAEKEKIFVTEKVVKQRVAEMAMAYGMDPHTLQQQLVESGRMVELRQTLKHEKVREYLRKKADVDDPSAPASETVASDE